MGRPPKVYRGSRSRLKKIRLRKNWSVQIWIILGVILLVLFVWIPLLIRNPLTYP